MGDLPQHRSQPRTRLNLAFQDLVSSESWDGELGDPFGIGDRVDLDDPVRGYGEGNNGDGQAGPRDDDAGRPVDEHAAQFGIDAGALARVAGDGCRASGHLRPTGTEIDSGHDIRVEHGDEGVEVAGAAGGEEGVHDLSLTGEITLLRGKLSLLHSAAGSAGQLPGCLWRTAHYRRNLVEG